MALRAAMVPTTTADPVLLKGYCENFTKYGHLDQVQVIVVPDRKTPPAIFERCDGLRKKGPMRAWVAACRQLATV